MKLLVEHFFSAFLVGCIGWLLSGNLYCVPSALIFGWLIDADHLCDFFFYFIRARKLNLALIERGDYFKMNDMVIVPLHAWEITSLLALLGIFIPEYRALYLTAATAHGTHLLQDQIAYRIRLFGYSLISRKSKSFAYKGFCKAGNG